MNKPILFVDFDGTLCHDRFWRSLPAAEYAKAQDLLFGGDGTYAQEWMLGKRTAESVNEYLATQLGMPYEKLWELFVSDARNMTVSVESLQNIQKLRTRYTAVLITVNMDSFSRFTVPALGLDSYFDAISNSYYEGKFKTDNDGQIFNEYLLKYNASVAESILIDDSTSACAVFESIGGIARQVDAQKDLSVHLSEILTEQGVS